MVDKPSASPTTTSPPPDSELPRWWLDVHYQSDVRGVVVGGVRLPKGFEVTVNMPSESADLVMTFTVTDSDGVSLTGLRTAPRSSKGPFTSVLELQHTAFDLAGPDYYRERGLNLALALFLHDHPPMDTEWTAETFDPVMKGAAVTVEKVLRKRAKHRLNDSLWTEVTEIYNAAVEAGRSPMAAIEDTWSVSHSTANKWAIEARKRGYPMQIPPRSKRANRPKPTEGKSS